MFIPAKPLSEIIYELCWINNRVLESYESWPISQNSHFHDFKQCNLNTIQEDMNLSLCSENSVIFILLNVFYFFVEINNRYVQSKGNLAAGK